MKLAQLFLIATPLDESVKLDGVSLDLLTKFQDQADTFFLVENHKVSRQRWLNWGLKREKIDEFIVYDEQTQESLNPELIKKMKAGKIFVMISDGGLPAWFDPGAKLVRLCHLQNIKVKCPYFTNSLMLTVCLSGYGDRAFYFAGFLPAKTEQRHLELKKMNKMKDLLVIMDTPYRLQALINDVLLIMGDCEAFISLNLNHPEDETYYFGTLKSIQTKLNAVKKAEFVLVINPLKNN